jgi:hypothetical protein
MTRAITNRPPIRIAMSILLLPTLTAFAQRTAIATGATSTDSSQDFEIPDIIVTARKRKPARQRWRIWEEPRRV